MIGEMEGMKMKVNNKGTSVERREKDKKKHHKTQADQDLIMLRTCVKELFT